MNASYLFLGLVAIALGFSIMAFVFKHFILAILAGGAWILNAVLAYIEMSTWTSIMPLVSFFVICAIAMFTFMFLNRQKTVIPPAEKYDRIKDIDISVEQYRAMRKRGR